MTGLSTFPTFEQFFTEITGHHPYLWQVEAAHRLGVDTPAVIDVGTGLGKTSVIHAWMWAFARDQVAIAADPARQRRVQTRLHLVVDRRILVDSAADAADEIAAALRHPGADQPAVQAVADAISPLAAEDGTLLSVRRLRGGTAGAPEHVRDPKVPAVITTTVDLAGSRLLFRGYGVSAGRRPIDAALIGADSLLVLDEAHLVPQFRHLLSDLDAEAEACETWFDDAVPPRATVVMTATHSGDQQGSVLRADVAAERAASAHLDTRLSHRDAIRLEHLAGPNDSTIPVTTSDLADAIAVAPPGSGEAVVAFVNTVRVARDLTGLLAKRLDNGIDVVTIIGGTPEPIRQDAMAIIAPYLTGAAGRDGARGLVVVSTQSLEVGADIDFDRGYTELSTMSSLVQRLGRVNRVGARPHATMTVFTGPSAGKDDAIYPPEARAAVADLLQGCATVADLDAARQDVTPETVDVPVRSETLVGLGRGELGELLDTRNTVTAADVATWIRPPARDWTVDIVFRAGVNDVALAAAADPAVLALYFDAAPVLRGERWSVSVSVLPEMLRALPEGVRNGVLIDDAARPASIHLDGKDSAAPVTQGTTLVLEADPWWTRRWIAGFGTVVRDRVPSRDGRPTRVVVTRITPHIDPLDPADIDPIAEDHGIDVDQYAVTVLTDDLIMLVPTPSAAAPEHKQRVTLADHNRAVGQRATAWAQALHLPEPIVTAIRVAGERHDLGKCDDGFQYLLHLSALRRNAAAPTHVDDGVLLAKSDLPDRLSHQGLWVARRDGGLRDGFRHEARSVIESAREGYPGLDPALVELVEYLIATHHGHYRGLGPVLSSPGGHDSLQDAHHEDWARWPDRVARLTTAYGPYTLALAEAILRLADWECSALPTVVQEDPT